MIRIVLLLFLFCFSALVHANAPKTTAMLTPSSVKHSMMWPNKALLDPDKFVKNFFKALEQDPYIERMDKVFEETIKETNNIKNKSKTVVKKVYFFVKPAIAKYPEAMVTFQTTVTTFYSTDPKAKKYPSASIVVSKPFHLYIDYFDFALSKFNIDSIAIGVSAKSTGSMWTISQSFNINDLFIIKWLNAAKDVLKFRQEPKVHTTLLFFKQRFDILGQTIYKTVQKS